METLNRRDVLAAFAALAAAAPAAAQVIVPHTAGEPVLNHSRAWTFDELPVKPSDNGGASRVIVDGVLPTGEKIEMHETTLPPGQMPHPPHTHRHSEFMMIREGTVEWELDGVTKRVGPGGVTFAASNQRHGIKNVGATDAIYFVIAIGREIGVTAVSR